MARQKSSFSIIVQLLMVAAVIFSGIAIVNALDRNSRETAALRRAIESMPRSAAAVVNVPAKAAPQTAQVPCGNAEFFAGNAPRGGVLRSAIASDVGTLNPVISNEATASSIIGMCTATLGSRNFNDPEKFEPMIAESWQLSGDGRKIRIKLRKNVMWQDFIDPYTNKLVPQQPVTAHDFVFYLDVIGNKKVNAGALRSYFQDLESAEALSDYELLLVWKNKYFRSLEMSLNLIPLPRHFYCPGGAEFDPVKFNDDHKRNAMIVGCGPYRLKEHIRDQRFVLQRFENYFGNALGIAPAVEKVVLEIVKAENTRFQMLLSNELDSLSLSPEQWKKRAGKKPFSRTVLSTGQSDRDQKLQPGEEFRLVKYPANAYFYIGYNMRKELFADPRVRQAMTMLCNRERILKEVYHGNGKVISGPFFYNSPYYDKTVKPLPYSPQEALKLLASAGWRDSDGDGILDKGNRKFIFSALQVAGNPVQEKLLSIFKEDLAKAGIDMKITALEWPVYINKLDQRDYEVCSLGWQLPFESDPYQVWHSSQIAAGSNHVGFADSRADKLIEDIRRSLDTEKRIKLCREFHKLIHQQQPYTFLVMPESMQALSGRIRNVRCFPLGLNSECFYLEQ